MGKRHWAIAAGALVTPACASLLGDEFRVSPAGAGADGADATDIDGQSMTPDATAEDGAIEADAPPPAVDAPTTDAPLVDGPCGALMQQCCKAPKSKCSSGLGCMGNSCVTLTASDTGKKCMDHEECSAKLCVPVGTAVNDRVCSQLCSSRSAPCTPGWTCTASPANPAVSACYCPMRGVEACNNLDDDCDGIVDGDTASTIGCGGGKCTKGVCESAEVAVVDGPPSDLVADGAGVFFATDDVGGQVWAYDHAARMHTSVAKPGYVTNLALDATRIYWTSSKNGLLAYTDRIPSGTTSTANNLNNPFGIAIDATNIYFASSGSSDIQACAKSTFGTFNVASSASGGPTRMTSDSLGVYWINGTGAVEGFPKNMAGGTHKYSGQSGVPSGIAVNASYLYWSDASGVYRCPVSLAAPCIPTKVFPLGGAISDVAGIVADKSTIYWSGHSDGVVYRMNNDDPMQVTPFASQQERPTFVAVDPQAVYWLTTQGNPIQTVLKRLQK